ncbi:protein PSY3 isoform X2 [Vitis vinifera]|uniref:protein PSY3 isoform X2 n=1 Tax=Vitis vinifera TaxID=29760 RepID=UPI00053FFA16|nr:protein PSY3 isoform X2 [Vitis vinifera]|eukprot:XP_010650892.1 PREDICTED: protein PSY3 isoform X2 [Vitis vinifera]
MGFGNRLWWCVFFASFLICTARNTLIFPDEEAAGAVGRRLKAVSTDDYSDPSANKGHDPRNRIGGGGWKGRDSSAP